MNKISFAFAIVMILGVFNVRAEVLDSTKVYPMDEVVVMASRVGSSLKNCQGSWLKEKGFFSNCMAHQRVLEAEFLPLQSMTGTTAKAISCKGP